MSTPSGILYLTRMRLATLSVTLAFWACRPLPHAPTVAPVPKQQPRMEEAIRAAQAAFINAAQAGDADAMSRLFSVDVVLITHVNDTIRGRRAIAESLKTVHPGAEQQRSGLPVFLRCGRVSTAPTTTANSRQRSGTQMGPPTQSTFRSSCAGVATRWATRRSRVRHSPSVKLTGRRGAANASILLPRNSRRVASPWWCIPSCRRSEGRREPWRGRFGNKGGTIPATCVQRVILVTTVRRRSHSVGRTSTSPGWERCVIGSRNPSPPFCSLVLFPKGLRSATMWRTALSWSCSGREGSVAPCSPISDQASTSRLVPRWNSRDGASRNMGCHTTPV